MKDRINSSAEAEFDSFSEEYGHYMDHPLRSFASGQDDTIFPEHKSYYLIRLIKQLFENYTHLNFLDYGCGHGALLKALLKQVKGSKENLNIDLSGVDISSEMIKEAREMWSKEKNKVEFDVLNEGKAPYESGSFDIVVASSVFHHIEPIDRPDVLKEIYRVLKPGGFFLMIEHNPLNPLTNYIVKRTPMDENAILLNPFEAKKLIKKNNFMHVRTDFFLFFPPKIRLLWPFERYIRWLMYGGQYVLINQKLT